MIERYDPIGRTEKFCGQVMIDIRAMYERGYNDGKNDTIEANRESSEYKRGFEDGMESIKNNYSADAEAAYKRGYENGMSVVKDNFNADEEGAYQRGLDDMRNAMLAISKWDNDYKAKAFHGNFGTLPIMREHEAKYIVDQVQRYQEEQAAHAAGIVVGDEVICSDVRGIVTFVNNQYLYIVYSDGSAGKWDRKDCERTGRHFDQIAEFLDKLKEGNKNERL